MNLRLQGLKTYSEAPVHTQMNGNQQDVFRKYIHFFGPAAYSTVATL